MLLHLVICEFNLFVFVVFAKHEQYNGHSLYQVNVKNIGEIGIIHNVVNQFYLDVWSHAIPGRHGHILVPKESKEVFEISLAAAGINYKIKVDNISELLNLENQQLKAAAIRNQRHKIHRESYEILFNTVYTYYEINTYLEYLAKTYSYVENVYGGNSVENRPINYLKISTTEFQDNKKPIVMIQSLLHAREWISSLITLYVIQNLVVAETEPDLLNNIDWIIVPVVNPDGYIYTHESDRLWRKNRRPAMCTGVDLNRNFDINWGSYSSRDACSESFHGNSPASEPETLVITNIITKYKNRIALFLDLHSYGSMILFAYGDGTLPENIYTVNHVGVMMAQAIDNVKFPSHPRYIVGNIPRILYEVSGCASDFAQNVGIPLSYTYELPEEDGFLLNHQTIEPTCFETWHGIIAGARYILNKTK